MGSRGRMPPGGGLGVSAGERPQRVSPFAMVLERLRQREGGEESSVRTRLFRPLPAVPTQWLLQTFPSYFQNPQGHVIPLAAHHHDLWNWIWHLRPGMLASSFIALWSRGGGKSASAELGATSVGYFGLRRYGLYIASAQEQADDHLMNVASMLEHLGVDRAVNRYGVSRGWRISRLRTADGFTLDSVGMDTAIRGARLDESRPDFVILDDLDAQHDSALTIEKKIKTLTRGILGAGTSSLAVLGVQNIPNADGIFARLADGRADFLLDRQVSGPHPALRDLPADGWWIQELPEEGPPRIRITQGTPTWVGQGIVECEALIAKIGIAAFLVECQHETGRLGGKLFQRAWFPIVPDWPRTGKTVRFWDFAGTEARPGSDPDWTAGALITEHRGQYWIRDMVHARLSPKGVEDLVAQTAALDGKAVPIWLEQEPGSSGKNTIDHYQRTVLKGFAVRGMRSTGSKVERATPVSSAAEAQNVFLVAGLWNQAYLDEMAFFPDGAHDDQCDATSGAFAVLAHGPQGIVGAPVGLQRSA